MNRIPPYQSTSATDYLGAGRDQSAAGSKTGSMTTAEGWEQCLREQVKTHPRIALGVGLLTGLIAGWWVKR